MSGFFLELITSVIGTAGFLIFFKMKMKNAPPALLCGILTFICCRTLDFAGIFLSNFVSAAFAAVVSEIAARIFKAPSNVFLIPGIIPLLPGAMLYYATLSFVGADYDTFFAFFEKTLYAVFGIALGILSASVVFEYFTVIVKNGEKRGV